MSLVTLTECRALVRTSLSDAELQTVIDRTEAELQNRIGPFQDDTGLVEVTEMGILNPSGLVLTQQPIASVVSLTVGTTLIGTYVVRGGAGMVTGLSAYSTGSTPPTYTIVYRPTDMQADLTRAVIDLVRLTIERTAMLSESVAGEYSYQAPSWDREHLRILRRVCPAVI